MTATEFIEVDANRVLVMVDVRARKTRTAGALLRPRAPAKPPAWARPRRLYKGWRLSRKGLSGPVIGMPACRRTSWKVPVSRGFFGCLGDVREWLPGDHLAWFVIDAV